MKKIFIAVLTGLFFSACTKEDVSVPSFDVSVDKMTYNLGDTVRFKFSGDADYLAMYSGENGSKYENRDRLRADGKITCEITARLLNTLGTRSLFIYATTELNALRDSTSIVNANWIDISNRYTIPTAATSAQTAIGTADLSDIVQPFKPLYIAFRSHVKTTATGAQDRWTIGKVLIQNKYNDGSGTSIVGEIKNMGWKTLNVKNDPIHGWVVSSTTLSQPTAARDAKETENWVVSGPVYPDAANRDYPKSVKDILEVLPETYEYVFNAKGIYKVVFVALNSRNGESSTITKEIEITIE
ncbi:DUF5017 domain-containing protein [Pseudopedobacter sp.]|uniref:DUF5017 domain-containing protein n=1 Tax=Pseudopedobacter sp. TaxID=1936787 RepID=UPI003340FDFC